MEAENKAAFLSLIPGQDLVTGRAGARYIRTHALFGHFCWPAQTWLRLIDLTVMQVQGSGQLEGGGREGCVDELSSSSRRKKLSGGGWRGTVRHENSVTVCPFFHQGLGLLQYVQEGPMVNKTCLCPQKCMGQGKKMNLLFW